MQLLEKNRQYSSETLFSELNVLDERQLYVRSLLIFLLSLFQSINNTRNSVAEAIKTPKLQKTKATTNAYYIVHILFRNILAQLKGFNNCSMTMFKLRINEWLRDIGRANVDASVLVVGRLLCWFRNIDEELSFHGARGDCAIVQFCTYYRLFIYRLLDQPC